MAVSELAQISFEHPEFLGAAAAAFAGGAYIDYAKEAALRKMSGVPIADPETAKNANIDGRRTRLAERAMHWAAATAITLAFVHAADPQKETTKSEGTASVALAANYAADTPDMADSQSRLGAGLEGVFDAAEDNDVPFNIVLFGDEAVSVASLSADNKDVDAARGKVETALQSTDLKNGSDNLDKGAKEAYGHSEEGQPNRVIVVASSAKSGETNSLKRLKARMGRAKNGDTIDIVVTGSSNKEVKVGNVAINAPVEPEVFKDAVGEQNVHTAKSSKEVKKAIDRILSQSQKTESIRDINGFGYGFVASAVTICGLALWRRASGTARGLRGN